MISIEKIIQQLQQCRDTSITLPQSNNCKYIQKTAIDIRKDELELLNTNFEQLNEANYTMDSEFEKLNKENETIKHTTEHLQKNNIKETIQAKSLIIYNENEATNIPEILLNLINEYNKYENKNSENNFLDSENIYIYGFKNPDSFYKSFLLLSKVDFIIKNKVDQKNEVATFKREMAVQYETFYKTLNYRKLKFSRNNMVSNLTNTDNYNDYDIFQYISDYTKNNFIILDIITEKYIDIKYSENTIINNDNTNNSINRNNTNYFIIIKYSNNTYLPLMNNSGEHYFNGNILNYIIKTYERLVFSKFKEAKDVTIDIETTTQTINKNDDSSKIDNIDDVDNIMEKYSTFNIEEAFNNSIKLQNENSIIKTNESLTNSSFTFEDMIDIEEEEEEENNNIEIITIENKTSEENKSENDKVIENSESSQSNDVFENIMKNIPVSKNKKNKDVIKDTQVNDEIKLVKTTKTTKTTPDTLLTTTAIATPYIKEELLPLNKYNLGDLQRLCLLYKIDTQKKGNGSKKINKLKTDLYDELQIAKQKSLF